MEHSDSDLLLRKKISGRQMLLVTAMMSTFIWIGWRIVVDTAAQNLAVKSPEAALRWAPDEHTALERLAQQELTDPDGDLDAAKDWAQRALRADPLDGHALFLLGFIAERQGDQHRADALAQRAGARSWRDISTQWWLFERAVRRRQFNSALQHADAMLRVNILDAAFLQLIFPALAAFTADPIAFQAMTDVLMTDPPWRKWYLASLSNQLADRSRLDELYAKLKDSKNPPSPAALRSYINRLVHDGRYKQAYQTWSDSLPAAARPDRRYPYNRDFKLAVDGMAFNWLLSPVTGADIRIAQIEGGRQLALKVEFSGARVQFANVQQMMLLPPGRYRLSGRVKAEDLRAQRGLWWHVFCATEARIGLGHTDLVSGDLPWTEFGMDFEVPADGCEAQWLQLELPARIASERKIEGQVWYQFLRIKPIPEEGDGRARNNY